MTNTIILPSWLISDTQKPPQKDWGVRIVGDQIDNVAPNSDLIQRYPEDKVWHADNQVLAPGFVNAHTHLYGILAHGIPLESAPSGFWPFLEDFWWPLVEDQLDQDMICAATNLQCANMLKSGVTTFYDCAEAPFALPGVLFAQAEIVRRLGIRGILSFEATERVSKENGQLGLQENQEFIKTCQKQSGLVSGMMCFHTTFTCSAEFIKQAFELAQALNIDTHMHCSEGIHEPAYTLEHFGKRTIHYYDQLGVADSDMIASQCVQVDQSEIDLMAEKGVRMTHMPLSNCEVGGGIAPIPELLEAGVTVGLGSDGYIDNFYEVMRGAFLIHKANQQDPGAMSADQVWYMATEGGANALGLKNVGRLEAGWQADIQMIDARLSTPLTGHNLYEQLLLYRNEIDVTAVLVAGRALMKDGELIDVDFEQLTSIVHDAASRLWQAGRQ